MIETWHVQNILADVSFPGITLETGIKKGEIFIRVVADGVCNVTGEPMLWKGRKWFVSKHSCKSEIVGTAFKAVMTAFEHEIRENFKYRGESIYDPHYDVDLLAKFREMPEKVLQERS